MLTSAKVPYNFLIPLGRTIELQRSITHAALLCGVVSLSSSNVVSSFHRLGRREVAMLLVFLQILEDTTDRRESIVRSLRSTERGPMHFGCCRMLRILQCQLELSNAD